MADAPLPAEPAADQPVEPENDDLSSKTAEPDPDWAPTEDPNATIVPGEMRSDREEIPAPFTKEDADKAETMEARQRMSRAAAGCQTYWPSPYEVCGIIRDKYNSLGGPASFLSFPNSPEYTNPNNSGKRTQFLNGPIYWSAATGAHPVVNSFLNRWGIHQYEAGWLKYPTTDEIVLPDGGRRQEFQQGAIYVAFQNAVGSAIQNGPLRDKYSTVGGLAPGGTLLGYLTEDHKRALPDGQGQMARFQNGVIYWHPTHGARVVRGSVLDQWASAGYEQGDYGYPIADEVVGGTDDTTQEFQGASIRSFRLFEGQFEYLEEDAAIKICQFQGRGDIVHWSRTWRDGVQIKDTASAHVTWKALRNCRPDTTAKLTAQLQVLEDDGSWSDRGALGSVPNARSGGGSSGNRAPANYACRGFGGNIWRVEGDVDINGGPDAADKHYGPNTLFPCE